MGSKQNYKKIAIEKKNFTDSVLVKLDHKFEDESIKTAFLDSLITCIDIN